MLQVIICEDDIQQLRYIEKKVKSLQSDFPFMVHSFTNQNDMMKQCKNLTGPFIFLIDIVLQENSNGIEVARQIHSKFSKSVIIFISAYLEKVTDIFETDHCYFIYKPELDQRLQLAFNKAIHLIQTFQKTISLKSGSKDIILTINDIYSIERIKRYSLIKTKHTTYRVNEDFKSLLQSLQGDFHQCHKSYIVNFNKVKEYTRTDFLLKDNNLVPISRSFSKTIHQEFQNYLIRNHH